MRVIDPAWIGKKLRGLKDLPEAQGDFFARQPGTEKQAVQPSTIAYVARLLIHRHEMLGVLDAAGYPTAGSSVLWTDAPAPGAAVPVAGRSMPGMRPPDADPPRRVRLLHQLRPHRRLRLTGPQLLLVKFRQIQPFSVVFGTLWGANFRPLNHKPLKGLSEQSAVSERGAAQCRRRRPGWP